MMSRKLGFIVLVLFFGLMLWMRVPLTALAAGPSNDDFTTPVVISNLPFSNAVDIGAASLEADEPSPTCIYPGEMTNSVWYAFTPTTSKLLTANISGPYPSLAVYTGTGLNALTQIGCSSYSRSFAAVAGTTYYFQVGNLYGYGGSATFSLDVAGPPVADFFYYPDAPSPFDVIQFYSSTYDPAGVGITSQNWDFGDGATTTDYYPSHRYAADGAYVVTFTATTADGRQATVTHTINVVTHDVSIIKFTTPNSGRTGQTSKIVVGINSRLHPETVTVVLYRSIPAGYQQIGVLTQYVPKDSKKGTTDFLFSYTFAPQDAAIGKVTFRAVASLENVNDALPADNEAISFPTKVSGTTVAAAGVGTEGAVQEGFVLRSQIDDNAEMRDLFSLPTQWLYLPTVDNK